MDKLSETSRLTTVLLIILLEGFVTISVEILTMRQLTPFVGNSVIVTSLIIGIFLLFLAMGYWAGGRHHDHYEEILRKNFILSAIWIGVGLSYPFASLFFYYLEVKHFLNLLTALLAYLCVITAPIVFWLGQTVPITTNLFRQELSVGAISGKVLFLSTLGSFLGAVLTSLFLFSYLGVAWTVVINFIALFALIGLLSRRSQWASMIILGLVGVLIYRVNVGMEKNYFLQANNYGNYHLEPHQTLLDGQQGQGFWINDSLSSFLDADKKAAPYIERIKAYLFKELQLTGKTILVVGAGGFSLTAESSFGNDVTYLDIDPDIARLAKPFVGTINGRFIAEDARVFMRRSQNLYDVIVNDVYSHKNAIPPHLLTREYLEELQSRLKSGGIAVFNMIATPTFADAYSMNMDHTIRTVFPYCISTPIHYSNRLTNLLYFCKKSNRRSAPLVYTDNMNPVTLDYFQAMQRTQRVLQKIHSSKV